MAQPTEFLTRLKSEENNARKLADIQKDYMLQKERKGNKNYDPDYKPGNPLYDADEVKFTRLDDLAKEAKTKFNNAKKGFETSEKQKAAKDNVVKGRLENIESGKTPDQIDADEAMSDVAEDLNKEYTQDVTQSGRYIAGLDDAGRKLLAESLNRVYKSELPTNGKYSKELKDAYVKALTDNYTRSLDFNQKTSLAEFLVIAQNEGTYAGRGGAGGSDLTDYVTISSPSVARGVINQVFQNELQRDATAEEFKQLVPGLIKAQKANPNKVKMVNGVRQTVQGLDAGQWITERLQKLPEYAQRKQDKTIPSIQLLQETARNNGLTLLPSQIESYRLRLQNGEKVETIQANIRANVANTMPDNVKKLMDAGNDLTEIYQPYRQSMATILELPIDKIDLNDPTLTNAITDKGNMTIFDFKKSLRKDPRWQYTDNARETVSSGLTTVLKDFGFMG
jgi:hypothetical protein